MFSQTTIPLVPTVTIPLHQFILMKRALRAAWTFREHQIEGSELPFPLPNAIEEMQTERDLWRQLEQNLNAEC